MAINPAEIGNDISGELKDVLSGDVEIAGKRIPKIALIGGGAGVIVLLFLISRRGGTPSNGLFQSKSEIPSDENAVTPDGFGTTDAPIGGSVSTPETPIDEGIGNLSENYPVLSLPTDNYGGYESYPPLQNIPLDSGFLGGYSTSDNYVPEIPTSYGFSTPSSVPLMKGKDIPLLKPSKTKDSGGVVKPSAIAKLGTALQKSSRGNELTGKLGNAPKLSAAGSFKPPPVTGFNKKGKYPVVSMAALVKNPTNIKPQQKQPAGISGASGKQNVIAPKPSAVKPTNYGNPFLNYFGGFTKPKPTIKTAPKAVQKKPPVYTKPKQTYIPQTKPSAKPVYKPSSYSTVPYNSNLFKTVKKPVVTSKKGK